MLRPVNSIYIEANGQQINVGKVICECDDGLKLCNPRQYITNTEWKEMQKNFENGDQTVSDMVYHCVGIFQNNIALKPIEKKWIDELISMGYQVENKLVYEIKEDK